MFYPVDSCIRPSDIPLKQFFNDSIYILLKATANLKTYMKDMLIHVMQ